MIPFLIALHLVISPIFFSLSPHEHFEFGKVIILLSVSLIILTLSIQNFIQNNLKYEDLLKYLKELFSDPISAGAVCFYISACLSTVTSVSPLISVVGTNESYSGILLITSYLVLFLSIRKYFQNIKNAQTLVCFILIGSLVSTTYTLLQSFGLDPLSWTRTLTQNGLLRPLGTLGHPNFLSAYLDMAIPIIGYMAYRAYTSKQKALFFSLIFIALAMLSAVGLAQSRGGWLALLAVLMTVFYGLSKEKINKKIIAYFILAPIPVIILGIGLLSFWITPENNHFFGQVLYNTKQRAFEIFNSPSRLPYWLGGLRIFKHYPIFGSGLDTFQMTFQMHRSPEFWLNEWAIAPHKAHNEIIHILATQGIAGFLGLVALLYGIVKAFRDLCRKSKKEENIFYLVLFSGIVAFCVQNLFSFTVSGIGNLFVTLAGLMSAQYQRVNYNSTSTSENEIKLNSYNKAIFFGFISVVLVFYHNFFPIDKNTRFAFYAILSMTIFSSGVLFLYFRMELDSKLDVLSQRFYRSLCVAGTWLCCCLFFVKFLFLPTKASITAKEGESILKHLPVEALTLFQKAVVMDRSQERYVVDVAHAAEDISKLAKDSKDKKDYRLLAIRAYEHAIKMNPAEPNHYYSLGVLLSDYAKLDLKDLKSKEAHNALIALEHAVKIEPNNPIYLYASANIAISLGDLNCARRIAEQGVKSYPEQSLSHYQLGYIEMIQKNYSQAIMHYKKAIYGNQFPGAPEEMKFNESTRIQSEDDVFKTLQRLEEMKKAES